MSSQIPTSCHPSPSPPPLLPQMALRPSVDSSAMKGALELKGIEDLVGKKESEMTAEEKDRLLSHPMVRQLQYQIQQGAREIKLESGHGQHTMRNVVMPEGADPSLHLRKVVAEEEISRARSKKENEAREAKLMQEAMARSDPLLYEVSGGGSPEVNGIYIRDGEALRNGSRVYKMSADGETPLPDGFMISHESVGGSEGFILGKAPRAWYAYQTKYRVCPEHGWSAQEHGKPPAPCFKAVEPLDAVEKLKAEGNAAFGAADHNAAVVKYTKAIELANACMPAPGLSDDLLGKMHGNRAEAFLQLKEFDKCIEDAQTSLEYDPCFVKGFVRKAKAAFCLDRYEMASRCLSDALEVVPGNKEILNLQEEYRVARIARSGKDQTLSEIASLCARLKSLVKRKGTASEVNAIFKQIPTLLQALKRVPDESSTVGAKYVSAPNRSAQVLLRLHTDGFALLAPLLRPPRGGGGGGISLLHACLDALTAALLDCPSNQCAFDKWAPQLIPLLRRKDTLPFELLRAAVKLAAVMAERAVGRRLLHDPGAAEGVVFVIAHPDSTLERAATRLFRAIEKANDMGTLYALLSLPQAGEVVWREALSRREEVHVPARALLASAFGHELCRRRLGCVERAERMVSLWREVVERAEELERYELGEDEGAEDFVVREFSGCEREALRVLCALVGGAAEECEGSMQLVEALHRHGAYDLIVTMCCAAGHSERVVQRLGRLGLFAWLLRCREESACSAALNANMASTLSSQRASDDACLLLGHAAELGSFHACVELFDKARDGEEVEGEDGGGKGWAVFNLCSALSAAPSDEAAAAGCRCLRSLLAGRGKKLRLGAEQVHDVLIPLWLRKDGYAKEAVGAALRCVLADAEWMRSCEAYFESRGSTSKLRQVVGEMSRLQQLKQLHTTSASTPPPPPPAPSSTLEEEVREGLEPNKVVSYLTQRLPPAPTVVDVGAGTGCFAIPLAQALPEGLVYACEVRSEMLSTLRSRAARLGLSNLKVTRMAEKSVHALPEGRRADLIFLCDVFGLVGESFREAYLLSLRSLLSPAGRLVVVDGREASDYYLADIEEAGFIQQRCAQVVCDRRMMLFTADPAAPPPPPLPAAPPALEGDKPVEGNSTATEQTDGQAEQRSGCTGAGLEDWVMEEVPAQGGRLTGGTGGQMEEAALCVDNLPDEPEKPDLCGLRQSYEASVRAPEELEGDGGDGDVRLLEPNGGGGSDEDGCVLEDNDAPSSAFQATAESDDDDCDCVLEEN